MSKRFLSLFTVLVLCFSLLPVSALAEKDKTVANEYVNVITNVKVMEHTHSFSAGRCDADIPAPTQTALLTTSAMTATRKLRQAYTA